MDLKQALESAPDEPSVLTVHRKDGLGGGGLDTPGVIVVAPGVPKNRVWLVNLLAEAEINAVFAGETPDGVKYEDFGSPDEVVAAGWAV